MKLQPVRLARHGTWYLARTCDCPICEPIRERDRAIQHAKNVRYREASRQGKQLRRAQVVGMNPFGGPLVLRPGPHPSSTPPQSALSDFEYGCQRAALHEIARFALAFSGPLELLRFQREADARLARPLELEQRRALASDYALASALQAYVEVVAGLAK